MCMGMCVCILRSGGPLVCVCASCRQRPAHAHAHMYMHMHMNMHMHMDMHLCIVLMRTCACTRWLHWPPARSLPTSKRKEGHRSARRVVGARACADLALVNAHHIHASQLGEAPRHCQAPDGREALMPQGSGVLDERRAPGDRQVGSEEHDEKQQVREPDLLGRPAR